jgi:uncharacterized protein
MLLVDIRDLRPGPVETAGEIPAEDETLAGLELDLVRPLRVSGTLDATGRGDFFWRGRFGGTVRTNCRRCLVEVEVPVDTSVEVLFSTDPDLLDDPSVYPLDDTATHVDVRQAVREELALAAPAFVLCREDCLGLCTTCGADLNEGRCRCGAPATS